MISSRTHREKENERERLTRRELNGGTRSGVMSRSSPHAVADRATEGAASARLTATMPPSTAEPISFSVWTANGVSALAPLHASVP